jgi:glucan-binding YG repeat protein
LSAAGIENAETRDTYDGHTWNAMKLDGKWYQVDCTWDDSSENYYNFNRTHLYFALSDELMAIAHQGHNKIYTVEGYATPSNSLEHNYFVQNGDAQQWVESYRNRIQENLNNKNTEFSIQADNSTYPPSIYGIQNGIIAYVMNQNEWFANGKKVELVAKTNDKQFDFIVTYPVVCTNHDWDEGVITTEPTCTTKGVKTFTCNNCKTTKIEEVDTLGHNYSKEWTIDREATCTQEGSKSHHCTRCDSKADATVIPELSHDWILTSTVNPTRDHEGKKVYTCNLCKETKEESIPKLVGKWVSNSVGKWYEYSDGTYENSGFKKIENETYYFTSNGYVKTGWLSVNNNWCFFKNSGCMVTSNWAGSYYMGSEGKMKTNAFTPDGYYCGADGVYVRNAWVNHNGNYYYMDANGLMTKNAWVGDYYLGADGVMKTNTFTPDGYYVGSDGAYYRNRWIKYENKYYYTNSAGLIVKNAWIEAYYLGSDGVMIVNSFTPDGYYVGADGAYLRNQKIEVDGKEYYLNAAGKVAKNQWVGDYFIDVNGNVVKKSLGRKLLVWRRW